MRAVRLRDVEVARVSVVRETARGHVEGNRAAGTAARVPTTRILGVPIARLDETAALAELSRLADEEAPAHVVHVNAHTLNLAHESPGYRAVLQRASLVLRDGVGVGLAAWLQGRPFPANLNGTDFTPLVLGLAAQRRWSVFLLGGQPGVADAAARQLRVQVPGLTIAGATHGYFPAHQAFAVARDIRRSATDVLLVAMGNPAQEQWLDRYLLETGARLGIGVGAYFDFVAGRVPRAPSWMRRARLEWVYRLVQEPRRLAYRYLAGNPMFVRRVVQEHLAATRQAPHRIESGGS
jgi:exopolysaccharide biosynthesis WecB/TagA/CpsF family protein